MLDSEGLRKCAFFHQYVYLAVWCHWQFFFFYLFIFYHIHCFGTKTEMHPALNTKCPRSLSFTTFFFWAVGLLWLFFVFLLFLFVISALLLLFWTPSVKSWLSRMQGSVVLIFAFSWCNVPLCLWSVSNLLLWPLLFVQLSAFIHLGTLMALPFLLMLLF